ncbi:K(+)-transporting ATPase subunit C [Sciscionella sediminilitoris]|uniref:K(+)-transporting ATPase subunit C n=1 Tax=Sciscionella sediminilitoris TaxID=1445613 RepID=UPI0004DF1A78|nr:K(+)-transporting ATPase subunit C [Sciscionella sp. SE31]
MRWFTAVLRQAGAGLRLLIVLTVILGICYPLAVYGVSRIPGLQSNAEGSQVKLDGQVVGSRLIGVDPVAKNPAADPYFHNRASASAKGALGPADPSTSGGSNLSGDSTELRGLVLERKEAIAKREGVTPDRVPADAVTASGSGLDPDISPAYAALQAPRVARVNHLDPGAVRRVIAEHTAGRQLGVLGAPTVNVLQLNLAIKKLGAH